jgi:hypothetical protein
MPWSEQDQAAALLRYEEFLADFTLNYGAWKNGIQSSNPAQYQAATEAVVRSWRDYVNELRDSSSQMRQNEGALDFLGQQMTDVVEQRRTLARLRSEAGTRTDQADSINPKSQPSPYTNVLGLQRTFRPSVREGLFYAAVVFSVLALVLVAYLGYQVVTSGQVVRPGYLTGPMTGGAVGRVRLR